MILVNLVLTCIIGTGIMFTPGAIIWILAEILPEPKKKEVEYKSEEEIKTIYAKESHKIQQALRKQKRESMTQEQYESQFMPRAQ